ncbi:hypothetical protein ACFL2H_12430, partial [Planctomycetota bacterium]
AFKSALSSGDPRFSRGDVGEWKLNPALSDQSTAANKLRHNLESIDSTKPLSEQVEELNESTKTIERNLQRALEKYFEATDSVQLEERKTELTRCVSESFALRQALQQTEVALLRDKIGRVENAIRSRNKNRVNIIQARVNELISE